MNKSVALSSFVVLVLIAGGFSLWKGAKQNPPSTLSIGSSSAAVDLGPVATDPTPGRQNSSSFDSVSTIAVDKPAGSPHGGVSAVSPQREESPELVEAPEDPVPVRWSGFEHARSGVEQLLGGGGEDHREDLLPRIGRTSGASGRFDQAAAAYLMFLDEFGIDHEYSRKMVMLLGDTLAPMHRRSIDIRHTSEGPRFTPDWKRGYTPTEERLGQACDAYEWAAKVGNNSKYIGTALLKLGWVHRMRGDLEASTEAWDRCFSLAPGTKPAADALWSAAENLAWTDQPLGAVDRLETLLASYPDERRRRSAESRVEALQAEARRGSEWIDDPIRSLEAEIAERAEVLDDVQVYRSVLTWLKRRQELKAAAVVARWGEGKADWPESARRQCLFDLAVVLKQNDRATSADIRSVAESLTEIVRGDADDEWAVSAGLQRCQLFRKIGEPVAAMDALDEVQPKAVGLRGWEPMWYAEMIELLIDRGEVARAEGYKQELSKRFPDHAVLGRLNRLP